MLKTILAEDRHFSDFSWLQTYWLFSFSNYYDPENIQFGGLRVYNDDVVQAGQGFGTHPHENMEIITLVMKGAVTHKDSMGNATTISVNEVQRMSAGTGIPHSEYNDGDEPVHFHQIWFLPEEHDLEPSYAQKKFDPENWKITLFPLASGQGLTGAVPFHSNASLYRCALDSGKKVDFEMGNERKIFIYMLSGEIEVAGKTLSQNDQLRVDLETQLHFEALEDSEFILIDAASCKGFGYSMKTLQGK